MDFWAIKAPATVHGRLDGFGNQIQVARGTQANPNQHSNLSPSTMSFIPPN